MLSAAVAATALIALPASAFAYQYYPEAAGGLFVTVLARFALLSQDARTSRMAWYGLVAGYLPWLHVRFLLLALVVLGLVVLTRHRRRAAVAVFAAAWALPVAALGAYYYYISGSPMPWALYALTEDTAAFDPTRLRHLPVYWFDREWGVVAHVPMYLAAVAGARLAWRHNRLAAGGAAALVLALALPASTHELTGGGTTPLRLVAAVVPLLTIPLMSAVMAPGTAVIRAAFVLLAVLSIQNAWMFNSTMMRFAPWLQGPTPSGWLTTLMMPHFNLLTMHQNPLSLFWAAATLGILVWGPALIVRGKATAGWRASGVTGAAAGVLAGFGLLATGFAAVSGEGFRPRLMPDRNDSASRLLAFHLEQPRGGVRWSARHGGQADPIQVLANPAGSKATLSPGDAGPEERSGDVHDRGPDTGWRRGLGPWRHGLR